MAVAGSTSDGIAFPLPADPPGPHTQRGTVFWSLLGMAVRDPDSHHRGRGNPCRLYHLQRWEGMAQSRARPTAPHRKTRRMAILGAGSFYLQLLIYTVTILLSSPSVSLKQQPRREASLAVIENFNRFLQLAKPAKRNALLLIVIFCPFLAGFSHHCTAGYHYVTQMPIQTKNAYVCCHSVCIVKQTYLLPWKLFSP